MAKQDLRDRLLKQKTEIKNSQSGGQFITIKEGVTRLRHLPVGEENMYAIEVVYVFLNQELGGHICPSTWGDRSAFKEMHEKFAASKDEADREFAKKKLRLGKKYASPVVKYTDESGSTVDERSGAKLVLLTSGLYQETIDLFLDEKEAGDFTDQDNGYDLKYTRTGKTLTDTEYTVRPCKPTKLKKPFRGKVFDPTAMAKELTPSYKETKELMERFLNTKTEDLDDEKPSREERLKKKKKKKSRDL